MREPRIDPKPPARRSSDGPRFVLDFDVLHEGQPQRLVSVEFTFRAWQTFASALNTPDSDTTLLEPIMTNWGRDVIAEWPKAGPELPPSITLHAERWQDPTHRCISPLDARIMLTRWGLVDRREPSEDATKVRTIHFPSDRSVGSLYLRNQGGEAKESWEHLADARGIVSVPPAKELKLVINQEPLAYAMEDQFERQRHVFDENLSPLADLGPDDLESLDLGLAVISDTGLAYVKALTGLRELTLWGVTTEFKLSVMGGYPQWHSANRITAAGLKILRSLTRLRQLTLTCTEITDEGLSHLRDLTELQGLKVDHTRITDNGLAGLQTLARLEELDISDTDVTGAGLAYLWGLPRLRNLTWHGKQVTDASLPYLSKLAALERLSLNYTEVTDTGLMHLPALTGLQALELVWARITDGGLVHLCTLSRLRHLNLGYTKLTDAGLPSLAALTGLSELNLQDTEVTDAGVALLRRALPDCDISR